MLFVVVGLLALLGCGGDSVKDAARFRFFNAFTDSEDVRVYVGDHLYSANRVGPALSFANDLAYGAAPSGAVDIRVNPYIDPNVNWATLSGQTLLKDGKYTAVGVTNNGTRTLYLFSDGVNQAAGTAYFRIINATSGRAPVYLTVTRDADASVVYQTSATGAGFPLGSSTGYRPTSVSSEEPARYVVNVFGASDLSNPLSGDLAVDLQSGFPTTIVLYNRSDGTVGIKTGVDVYPGP